MVEKRIQYFYLQEISTLKHREKIDWKMMKGRKCVRDISNTVKSFSPLIMEGSIIQRKNRAEAISELIIHECPQMMKDIPSHNMKLAEITSLLEDHTQGTEMNQS